MRRLILLGIVAGAMLFSACDSTEGAGGGGLEPSAEDQVIMEAYICGFVENDNPGGIDNSFFPDDQIYLWMLWDNFYGNHTIRILWVDPNNKIYETERSYDVKSGRLKTYFWLDTTATAPTGKWFAEVYLDDDFVASYGFWLLVSDY